MKNNVLSSFVIFFAVVACLLIIDDLAYRDDNSVATKVSQKDLKKVDSSGEDIAVSELEIED